MHKRVSLLLALFTDWSAGCYSFSRRLCCSAGRCQSPAATGAGSCAGEGQGPCLGVEELLFRNSQCKVDWMDWEDQGLPPFISPCSCRVVWEFLNDDIMAVVLFPPAELTMACGSCASGGHTDVLTEADPAVCCRVALAMAGLEGWSLSRTWCLKSVHPAKICIR